jgi:hypothetical protein
MFREVQPAEVCMADEHGKEVPRRRRGTPRTECITSVKSFAEGDN